MILIPAIDLKGGYCVRLAQGKMDESTIYSMDPLSQAERWLDAGAVRLHIIDLDGAVNGSPMHLETIKRIAYHCRGVDIQVGGGIRTFEAAKAYFDVGVDFVILGTQAVKNPDFVTEVISEYPGKVFVSIDTIGKEVAVKGWTQSEKMNAAELALKLQNCGASTIIHTDISRDGMLKGANITASKRLAKDLRIPVIVAGGVRNMTDIKKVYRSWNHGILGAIVGRAIYEGTLNYGEAQAYIGRNLVLS